MSKAISFATISILSPPIILLAFSSSSWIRTRISTFAQTFSFVFSFLAQVLSFFPKKKKCGGKN